MKTGERRGNAGPWKTRKTKPRFPIVSPRPWKSLRDSHIPTAPAMAVFLPKTNPKKPRKEPGRASNLNSPLQAHSWIRKCSFSLGLMQDESEAGVSFSLDLPPFLTQPVSLSEK